MHLYLREKEKGAWRCGSTADTNGQKTTVEPWWWAVNDG